MGRMRIFVTGAAGYVGSFMLPALEQLDAVSEMIGVDLKPRPAHLSGCTKLSWIQADVSGGEWLTEVRDRQIDALVHLAFQIPQLYGTEEEKQRRRNIEGARRVFSFALAEPTVRRVLHFSTISAYGAGPANCVEKRLVEEAPLTETEYLYGRQKKEIETILRELYARTEGAKHLIVLRCASITGPYGRRQGCDRSRIARRGSCGRGSRTGLGRFGIVSTLTNALPVLPCGRDDFGRQYLHEDDVVDIVTTILSAPLKPRMEVFNASPEDYLTAKDLGDLIGKRPLVVPPVVLRMAFAALWRMTRGRIQTPPGAWKFLTFPIAVDGTRLTSTYGYHYRFTSREALLAVKGRYAEELSTAENGSREPEQNAP